MSREDLINEYAHKIAELEKKLSSNLHRHNFKEIENEINIAINEFLDGTQGDVYAASLLDDRIQQLLTK